MRSIYFIVDFSYNPLAQEPLKLFELGDAFTSGHPKKSIKNKKTTYSLLVDDLAQRYPNALLIHVYPSGLNLLDLSNKIEYLSYDNSRFVLNNSPKDIPPSALAVSNLVGELLEHADKRNKNSKPLVVYLGNSSTLYGVDTSSFREKQNNLELVNDCATEFHNALFNKSVLHRNANGNPLYPMTLLINFQKQSETELQEQIQNFMQQANAEYYVLKPTDGTLSEHIHVISVQSLENTIQRIKTFKYNPEASRRYHSSGLLVQVCHPSQLIQHEGQYFHAKGRAFIRADFTEENHEPQLHFIIGYWQLANKPYDKALNDSNLIAYGAANREGVMEIESDDWNTIKKLFNQHLPSLLASLDNNKNDPDCIMSLSNKSDSSPQKVFANSLTQFFSQQCIIPTGDTWSQNTYFWWNKYIEDSANKEMAKHFIMDFAGIDEDYKKNIPQDKRTILEFTTDAVDILFNSNLALDAPKNNKIGYSAYLSSFLSYFFLFATLNALHELEEKNTCSSTSFIMGILGAIVTQSSRGLLSSVQKTSSYQTFFAIRTLKHQELSPNEMKHFELAS